MIENVRTSYYAEIDNFCNWLRLASKPTNPHRLDDLLTAAQYLGRVELLAAILRVEDGDQEPEAEAETLRDEYRRVKEDFL